MKGNIISDAEGLKRSTNETDGIYRYGDTVYISGTRGGPLDHEWTHNFKYIAKPIITDIGSKILGLKSITEKPDIELNKIDRVKNTLNYLNNNPDVKKVVGFSVGGIASDVAKQQYKDLRGNVYGTPSINFLGIKNNGSNLNRYRIAGDILASLDNSASTKFIPSKLFNPIGAHSFQEQGSKNFASDASQAFGKVANDGSLLLFQ